MFARHLRHATGTPAPSPGTTPDWVAFGTPHTGSATALDPAYGTNVAGDLFVMVVAGRITSVTTPSGWTLEVGPNDQVGRKCYLYTRDGRSTGGESGTVAVTAVADSVVATIHTFRDVAGFPVDPVEDPSTSGSASNGAGPLPPSIAAGGNNRLAVFASADGNRVTYLDDIAGESGGTWVLRHTAQSGTGNNCSYALYTADLDAGGTISGGAGGVTLDEHSTCGLALVGL